MRSAQNFQKINCYVIIASIRYSVFSIRLFAIRYSLFVFKDIRGIRYSCFFTILLPLIFMIYFVPKVFALAPTLAPTTILQLQNKRKALINSFALNIILKILHDVAIL